MYCEHTSITPIEVQKVVYLPQKLVYLLIFTVISVISKHFYSSDSISTNIMNFKQCTRNNIKTLEKLHLYSYQGANRTVEARVQCKIPLYCWLVNLQIFLVYIENFPEKRINGFFILNRYHYIIPSKYKNYKTFHGVLCLHDSISD